MRAFVLVGHTQPLDPSFSLDDLPGAAGRLDVICRNLTASLLLSHGIREDVTTWIVLQDALTIEVRGASVRHLHPDERSTAALLRRALETAADRAFGSRPVESTPGIYVRRQGLDETLEGLVVDHTLIQLVPSGEQLTTDNVPSNPAYLLSDHQPFQPAEQSVVNDHDANAYSVGPRVLHGDQAISIAHNILDRAAETSDSDTPRT